MRRLRHRLHDTTPEEWLLDALLGAVMVVLLAAGFWKLAEDGHATPVTEVRADGKETYIQSGWLRASQRALDETKSDPLHAVPTFAKADAAPLPTGLSMRCC